MSKPSDWDQRLAERIVARSLRGRAVSRDVRGAPQRMHDFDLLLADRLIAIEVTRFTDSGRLQQLAEIRRLWDDAGRQAWVIGGLRHGWHILVGPHSHIRRLHAAIGDLLQVLERTGLNKLRTSVSPTSTADEETKAAVGGLHELGAFAVQTLDGLSAGEIVVAPIEPAGTTGRDLMAGRRGRGVGGRGTVPGPHPSVSAARWMDRLRRVERRRTRETSNWSTPIAAPSSITGEVGAGWANEDGRPRARQPT